MIETNSRNLEIIAGPCSINYGNLHELYEVANITTKDGPAAYGGRLVPLKSRTAFDETGKGMGMDFEALDILAEDPDADVEVPSVRIAEELVRETNLLIATEVMDPQLQLPQYEGRIPAGKLLAWNPSVNQLGWPIRRTRRYALKNGWKMGIKNGKALGATLEEANRPDRQPTPMETTWNGLATYARGANETILIHRGVDVPEKGDFRNAPVHEAARRVKKNNPDMKLYLDPSHICGPKLRDTIIDFTIRAMHMRDGDEFLYNGILIEAGTSETDTEQHVTIAELRDMALELSSFRRLRGPEPSGVIFQSISIPAA